MQAPPDPTHVAGGAHAPDWQVSPEQHSEVALQPLPLTWHAVGVAHAPDWHASPAQHSEVSTHR